MCISTAPACRTNGIRCVLFAGLLSTTGFGWLAPLLESKIGLGDTCGVHNLHGMPGLLGGFIAGLAAFGQAAGATPHGNKQIGCVA